MQLCPCGSLYPYVQCCSTYLNEQATPATPEALMRSRYTAYSQANITYIQKTMQGKAAVGFDAESAKHWASSVHWLGLKVLKATPHPTERSIGYVEFQAKYLNKDTLHTMHEISEFQNVDGVWFYVDGQQIPIPKQRIGRNAPCPCGSERKFKNCHFCSQ